MDKLETIIAGEITLSTSPGGSMKKWREIFGISQTDLSKYLKVSSSTISDYEGGRRQSPGIAVIRRLVNALIEMDHQRGGKILKQLQKDFQPKEDTFDGHEFIEAVRATEFVKKIKAEIVTSPNRIKDTQIYGYTIIDSMKVILDVPVHEYMQLYGKTPDRALIFQQVENGRSPLIAVKIGRFSTDLKPSLIILHGNLRPDKVDKIAIKIAESEKIPLAVSSMPIEEIKKILGKYETN